MPLVGGCVAGYRVPSGWAAAAALGYAGTVAMGRATMLYFERGGQQVGQKEMAEIQRRATEEARTFVSRFRKK